MLKQADIEQRQFIAMQMISRLNQAVMGGVGQLPACQVYPECSQVAIAICRARVLCKQRGCKRKICQLHGVPLKDDGLFGCCTESTSGSNKTTGAAEQALSYYP